MKAVVVLFVALLVAGVTGLTPDQKENLHNTNLHHIGNLDELARNCLDQLMRALEVRETYLRLGNAIKDGHSIMYEFVSGDVNQIKSLAPQFKLQVKPSKQCKCNSCCGRIILPGGKVVSAVAVPSTRQERQGLAASLDPKDKLPSNSGSVKATVDHVANQQRLKFGLDADKIQWYYDNNMAQISKMDQNAQLFIKKLVDDLKEKSPKTIIQLLSPVPNGHAVRFDLVRGNVSTIQSLASKCGVKVSRNTITAPDKDVVVKTAEQGAETIDGHIVAEHLDHPEPNGVPEKVNVVPAKKRNVVAQLPDKWITSLLEDDEHEQMIDAEFEDDHEDEEDEHEDAFIEEAADELNEAEGDEDAYLVESL